MSTPDISVVMSVYNGEDQLRETIDSILSQEGVSLEFIIVDDGSTDQSPQILKEYAQHDARVKLIQQENQGLTRALITGCASAVGKYLARQDTGDISLPDRLAKQFAFIERYPDSAFVSCGTRFVGPLSEHLYDVQCQPANNSDPVRALAAATVRGPSSHPSTMFSRLLYETVGGYRPEFYFAQDIDLWLRLAAHGEHRIMPEVLYQATVSVNSLSGSFRNEQVKTVNLIFESARRRQEGLSDQLVLAKALKIKPNPNKRTSRLRRASALYFIGACLRRTQSPRASYYFRHALQTYPLHLRSALRLLFG